MSTPAVRVDQLSVVYGRGSAQEVLAVDGFDLIVDWGEIAGIVGPSGSGKTTLLMALCGMVPPTTGAVVVGGVDVSALTGPDLEAYRRASIGVVFQGFNLLPGLTAIENVALPLIIGGARRGEARARALTVLEELGMGDRASHRPAELSGGQKQRVAVARGLVGDPDVLLADEPTANLDAESARAVIDLLESLRASGRAVVVSTHDERIRGVFDSVVPMGSSILSDLASTDETRHSGDRGIVPNSVELREGLRREERFADGVPVYERGDVASHGFEVISGAVVVEDDSGRVGVVRSGGRFGEVEPRLGCARAATVRAEGECVVRPV